MPSPWYWNAVNGVPSTALNLVQTRVYIEPRELVGLVLLEAVGPVYEVVALGEGDVLAVAVRVHLAVVDEIATCLVEVFRSPDSAAALPEPLRRALRARIPPRRAFPHITVIGPVNAVGRGTH